MNAFTLHLVDKVFKSESCWKISIACPCSGARRGRKQSPLALMQASLCGGRSLLHVLEVPFAHRSIRRWVYWSSQSLTFQFLEEDKVNSWKFASKKKKEATLIFPTGILLQSAVRFRTTDENGSRTITKPMPPEGQWLATLRSIRDPSLSLVHGPASPLGAWKT